MNSEILQIRITRQCFHLSNSVQPLLPFLSLSRPPSGSAPYQWGIYYLNIILLLSSYLYARPPSGSAPYQWEIFYLNILLLIPFNLCSRSPSGSAPSMHSLILSHFFYRQPLALRINISRSILNLCRLTYLFYKK